MKSTSTPEGRKRASEHLKNADRLLKANDIEGALKEVEQALGEDPGNVYALAYQQRIQTMREDALKKAGKTPQLPPEEIVPPVAPRAPEAVHGQPPPIPAAQEEVKPPEPPAPPEIPQPEPAREIRRESPRRPKSTGQHRKLAAIMFTDMVGYSKLTQRNEMLALRLLEEQRSLLRPVFPKFDGVEIKTIGDAFLVEFTSVLHAVRCAIEIQNLLLEHSQSVPPDQQFQIRIGIHLGDVVYQESDIIGDGVNIASRIYQQAEPGGICVSGDVYNQIRHRDEFQIETLGEVTLKNILTPIFLYRIVTPAQLYQRELESTLRKTEEEARLTARSQKLSEFLTNARMMLEQHALDDSLQNIMKVFSIDPEQQDAKAIEEQIRRERTEALAKEAGVAKDIPREQVLGVFKRILTQAWMYGAPKNELQMVLSIFRSTFNISDDEYKLLEPSVRSEAFENSYRDLLVKGISLGGDDPEIAQLRTEMQISDDEYKAIELRVKGKTS